MGNKFPKKQNDGIRVLLFSKYRLVQECLKSLIESNSDLSVEGTYSTAENIGSLTKVARSHVAVVELSHGDRLEIISDLLQKIPSIRVVVIVDGVDFDSQAMALKLGAVGIVRKEQSPRLLIEAIRQTHKGETWLNQILLNKILENKESNGKKAPKSKTKFDLESLTARELDVIRMIGEGLKNKEAGERLSISEATVRHHLSSIYGKIGVEDRLNLVILAYQRGLIKLPAAPVETVP